MNDFQLDSNNQEKECEDDIMIQLDSQNTNKYQADLDRRETQDKKHEEWNQKFNHEINEQVAHDDKPSVRFWHKTRNILNAFNPYAD